MKQRESRPPCSRSNHIRIKGDEHENAAGAIGARGTNPCGSGSAYDGKPPYTVSIMEFRGDKVARETPYFADPFVAPTWRAPWVE